MFCFCVRPFQFELVSNATVRWIGQQFCYLARPPKWISGHRIVTLSLKAGYAYHDVRFVAASKEQTTCDWSGNPTSSRATSLISRVLVSSNVGPTFKLVEALGSAKHRFLLRTTAGCTGTCYVGVFESIIARPSPSVADGHPPTRAQLKLQQSQAAS